MIHTDSDLLWQRHAAAARAAIAGWRSGHPEDTRQLCFTSNVAQRGGIIRVLMDCGTELAGNVVAYYRLEKHADPD